MVRKLKDSPYVGSVLLDALVTSERTVSMEALEATPPDYGAAFAGDFSNSWTKLVLATHASNDS